MKAIIAAIMLALCLGCSSQETQVGQTQQALASATEVALVGGVTTNSAKVGFRTDAAASVQVEYATNPNFNNSTTTSAVSTSSSDDFTGVIALSGLASNQGHWYRLVVDGVVQDPGFVQKFATFPTSGDCTFAVFADVANADRNAIVYQRGKDDGALFALQIGDMDHGNPSTLAESRAMHRDNRDPAKVHGEDFAKQILSKMGVAHVWDDHDYCDDDEDKNCSSKSTAMQAYNEYWPGYDRPNPTDGVYHSFVCPNVEVFMLDTRFQRDPNTDTDDSNKSMLGDTQKTWLKNALQNSTATWKVVVSSVTANLDARPSSNDHWMGGFTTEAQEMADFLVDENITNVVMVSADIHTGGAVDDGTNNGWGIPEISVAHTNLANGNSANLGTWSEGVTAGTNGRSGYALITATSTSLTLQAKAKNGTVRHSLTL